MQGDAELQAGADDASRCGLAARLLRLLRDTPLARALPAAEAAAPASVALAALTSALPSLSIALFIPRAQARARLCQWALQVGECTAAPAVLPSCSARPGICAHKGSLGLK